MTKSLAQAGCECVVPGCSSRHHLTSPKGRNAGNRRARRDIEKGVLGFSVDWMFRTRGSGLVKVAELPQFCTSCALIANLQCQIGEQLQLSIEAVVLRHGWLDIRGNIYEGKAAVTGKERNVAGRCRIRGEGGQSGSGLKRFSEGNIQALTEP